MGQQPSEEAEAETSILSQDTLRVYQDSQQKLKLKENILNLYVDLEKGKFFQNTKKKNKEGRHTLSKWIKTIVVS